jgi:hypothetical protein
VAASMMAVGAGLHQIVAEAMDAKIYTVMNPG